MSGAHADEIVLMHFSDEQSAQIHGVMLSTQRFEPDELSAKSDADVGLAALPADDALATDLAHYATFWVMQWRQFCRHLAGADRVSACRGSQAKGFMGPALIVVLAPPVTAELVLPAAGSRRLERFGLVTAVHLLMCGVVPWTGSAGKLHAYAQA